GSPRCTGAPCTSGNRDVTWIARIAAAARSGRIETTIGPWNGPAAMVGMLVRYIATLRFWSMWRIARPASSSACSNENEQPMTKLPCTWSRARPLVCEVHAPLRIAARASATAAEGALNVALCLTPDFTRFPVHADALDWGGLCCSGLGRSNKKYFAYLIAFFD